MKLPIKLRIKLRGYEHPWLQPQRWSLRRLSGFLGALCIPVLESPFRILLSATFANLLSRPGAWAEAASIQVGSILTLPPGQARTFQSAATSNGRRALGADWKRGADLENSRTQACPPAL